MCLLFKPVTLVIRPEASYLKKLWSSILNQSNIKGWNWKLMSIIQKDLKISIKN
jgi:hypothetical protein